MPAQYNSPPSVPSTAGEQIRTDLYDRKALMEAAKEMYFGQMADTRSMPKHMGKEIKLYHILPVLDDLNVNDQGLDANGNATTLTKTITIQPPGINFNVYLDRYSITGEGATAGAATTAAQEAFNQYFNNVPDGAGGTLFDTDYPTTLAAVQALGYVVDESIAAVPNTGNLYGSSKDVGFITGKMPRLTENGGKVNRIGHSRITLKGTFEKFGFHDSYTKESLDFDSDAEREKHIRMENIKAANEIYEDALQIDLLNSAGIVRFGGIATATAEISGESGEVSTITYLDLQRTSIDLDDNRCPKHTTMVKGSRMIDTQTIDSARILYIGTELQTTVEKMQDSFGNPAFVSREKYGAATKILRGEIGSIYQFRIVVVPEMMHWAAAGKAVTTNTGYRSSLDAGGTERYDVFPMLVVGDSAFTTIGFQSGGKGNKFKIKHSPPESSESYSLEDPYGEKGFHSIKWYYGFLLLRSERIALLKCVAPW